MNNGGCRCDENLIGCIVTCSNAAGSFTCVCQEGYYLEEDGVTCNSNAPLTVVLCNNFVGMIMSCYNCTESEAAAETTAPIKVRLLCDTAVIINITQCCFEVQIIKNTFIPYDTIIFNTRVADTKIN